MTTPTPATGDPETDDGGTDEVPDYLEALDVVPDDIAIVGELDDELITYLDDIDEAVRAEIASELGIDNPGGNAILRELVSRIDNEQLTERLAEQLDELIPLPPVLEQIDGLVINQLADALAARLQEELMEALT